MHSLQFPEIMLVPELILMLWNFTDHYCVHSILPWKHILSQLNAIQVISVISDICLIILLSIRNYFISVFRTGLVRTLSRIHATRFAHSAIYFVAL